MNRQEAITFLKEVISVCKNISPDAVVITSNKTLNRFDYKLTFKSVDGANLSLIQSLVAKRNLEYVSYEGFVTIRSKAS